MFILHIWNSAIFLKKKKKKAGLFYSLSQSLCVSQPKLKPQTRTPVPWPVQSSLKQACSISLLLAEGK